MMKNQIEKAVMEINTKLPTIQKELERKHGYKLVTVDRAYFNPSIYGFKLYCNKVKGIEVDYIGCKNTIFKTDINDGIETNRLFRYIHDIFHLENNLKFDYENEKLVAYRTSDYLRENTDLSKLAIKILEIDILLQAYYYDEYKEFVKNQYEYVSKFLKVVTNVYDFLYPYELEKLIRLYVHNNAPCKG